MRLNRIIIINYFFYRLYIFSIITVLILFYHTTGHASTIDCNTVLNNAVCVKEYKNRIIRLTPEQVHFIIENSVYILDILRMSDPDSYKEILPVLSKYKINGTPDKFTIKSFKSVLDLKRTVLSEKAICYSGSGTADAFDVPVTGELAISIQLIYNDITNDECILDFKVGFKPENEIAASIMEPFAGLFSERLDQIADQSLSSGEKSLPQLYKEFEKHFSADSLMKLASRQFQEKQEMSDRLNQYIFKSLLEDGKGFYSVKNLIMFILLLGTMIGAACIFFRFIRKDKQ